MRGLSLVVLLFGATAFADPPAIYPAQSERARQNANTFYDEVFDAQGKIRDHYADLYPLYLKRTPEDLSRIRNGTLRDFRGDNSLSPLPKVIRGDEFREIQKGVAQRGRALMMFLEDYYSGEKKFLNDGVIPENVLKQIVERNGEAGFEGHIDPKRISFIYGPDLMRDRDGVVRIFEDNTNAVGFQGDLQLAQESFLKHNPEMADILKKEPINDPKAFYRDLYERYRAQMPDPSQKMVVFATPDYPDPDNENFRIKKIWEDLGVEWTAPYGPKQLKVKPDGVYMAKHVNGKVKEEKVGFILFNSEFHLVDPEFQPGREQLMLSRAKELLGAEKDELDRPLPGSLRKGLERALKLDPKTGKSDYRKIENILQTYEGKSSEKLGRAGFQSGLYRDTVPGLVKAITSGKVISNNVPGMEFTNDKEFYLYMEDLIRYYLHEEPIIRNIPAERLYRTNAKGERELVENVFAKLEKNPEGYVVKVVDGRGGKGVWVLPKMSAEDRANLLKALQAGDSGKKVPHGYEMLADKSREIIVQDYKHISVLGDEIGDLRVISQIGPPTLAGTKYTDVYVPEAAAARGSSMHGDGKVNISPEGHAKPKPGEIALEDPTVRASHEVPVIIRKKFDSTTSANFSPSLSCGAYYRGLTGPHGR